MRSPPDGKWGAVECGGERAAGRLAPHEPRRSAVQLPEQDPPVQSPAPSSPARRPVPLALALPWLTVTLMYPVGVTLPAMSKPAAPPLASVPLVMRIG